MAGVVCPARALMQQYLGMGIPSLQALLHISVCGAEDACCLSTGQVRVSRCAGAGSSGYEAKFEGVVVQREDKS